MKTMMVSLAVMVLMLAGCKNDPIETSNTNNPDVQVQRLFDHEGCSVYRFSDGGNSHYYANCGAGTTTMMGATTESCGKNCTSTVEHAVVTTYPVNR